MHRYVTHGDMSLAAGYAITLCRVDTVQPLLLVTTRREECIVQMTERTGVRGCQWQFFCGRQTDAHVSRISSVCGRKEQELGDTSLL